MESVKEKKLIIRKKTATIIDGLLENELSEKNELIKNRLFEFANFQESKIVLLYVTNSYEVNTANILKECFNSEKIVVLPVFDTKKRDMKLMKADNYISDLKIGPRGILEPVAGKCKIVPVELIDIAIIPGIALDEKGGRIGSGEGYYDRLIPRLSVTTRKVALAYEDQIIKQVPTEAHDRHVDIIITEKRIIYKI